MESIYHCVSCHVQLLNEYQLPSYYYIICAQCLFLSLFQGYINQLQDNQIIEFSFTNQTFFLSLLQIQEILAQFNQIQFNENTQKACQVHHLLVELFCADCQVAICNSCAINGSPHFGHNLDTRESLIDYLNQIPNMECLNLDEVENIFMDKYNQIFKYRKLTLDKLDEFKMEFDRVNLVLKILRLLYTKLYSDIIDKINDITFLAFLTRIHFVTPIICIDEKQMIKIHFEEIPFKKKYCYSLQLILTGHTQIVTSLIQLKDGRIASGSFDTTVRIWEIHDENFICTLILTGHTSKIFSLIQLSNGLIASGSNDNCLKIWKITQNTFACIQTLLHTSGIKSLIQLQDGRIVSGSMDSSIRIWETVSSVFCCSAVLQDNNGGVYALIQMRDGRIISADGIEIKIWQTDGGTLKCIQSIPGHKWVNVLLELKDGRLASGSCDKTIKIWRYRENSFTCTHNLIGHNNWILSLIQVKTGGLVSGSWDNTIKLWEICDKNLKLGQILNGHKGDVYTLLQINDGRIMSGSADKTIRIWWEKK